VKQRRGLSHVPPERRRQIAARGMKALRAHKQEHQFTTDEAKDAAKARKDRDGAKV